jgi:hypothetical protein
MEFVPEDVGVAANNDGELHSQATQAGLEFEPAEPVGCYKLYQDGRKGLLSRGCLREGLDRLVERVA